MHRRALVAVHGLAALGLLLVALSPSAALAQRSGTDNGLPGIRTIPPQPIDVAAIRTVEASVLSGPDARADALRDLHLGFEIATSAALVLTASLGVIAAINQPTAFGDGLCARGDAILGQEYGCTHLSTLHGAAAFASVTLYTAAFVFDLVSPDLPEDGLSLPRDILNIVSLVGILTTPALGILSRYPGVVGVDLQSQADFSETMRTVHLAVAITTATAYLAMLVIDLARR